jgi:hypothetical protein
MWSIQLSFCNNGNINRRVSQTQLQYSLKYLQTEKTPSSFESNHSTSIKTYGALLQPTRCNNNLRTKALGLTPTTHGIQHAT